MSKHLEDLVINVRKDKAYSFIREAITKIGYRIMSESENFISIKEAASFNMMKVTWSAQIDIYIQEDGETTNITLDGSIFGFGPIQHGHIKGEVGRFANIIHSVIDQRQKTNTTENKITLSDEIEKLIKLKEKGMLNDEEFSKAKLKLLS